MFSRARCRLTDLQKNTDCLHGWKYFCKMSEKIIKSTNTKLFTGHFILWCLQNVQNLMFQQCTIELSPPLILQVYLLNNYMKFHFLAVM